MDESTDVQVAKLAETLSRSVRFRLPRVRVTYDGIINAALLVAGLALATFFALLANAILHQDLHLVELSAEAALGVIVFVFIAVLFQRSK